MFFHKKFNVLNLRCETNIEKGKAVHRGPVD